MKSSVTVSNDLHKQILLTSAKLFVERGYKGLSMREIAEALGVSKASLYYHFKDKEDLFLAILVDSIEQLGKLVRSAKEVDGTTREKVRFFFYKIAKDKTQRRGVMRLAEHEAVHLSKESQKLMRELYYKNFPAQLEEILREGQANSELRDFNVQQGARVLLGLALPLLSVKKKDLDATVDLLESIFFDGTLQRKEDV